MGRADFDPKRHLLENVCLNLALDGATLYLERRELFDSLIEGLPLEKSRGDRTPLELFLAGIRGWEAGLQRLFVRLPDDSDRNDQANLPAVQGEL